MRTDVTSGIALTRWKHQLINVAATGCWDRDTVALDTVLQLLRIRFFSLEKSHVLVNFDVVLTSWEPCHIVDDSIYSPLKLIEYIYMEFLKKYNMNVITCYELLKWIQSWLFQLCVLNIAAKCHSFFSIICCELLYDEKFAIFIYFMSSVFYKVLRKINLASEWLHEWINKSWWYVRGIQKIQLSCKFKVFILA